MIRLFKVYYPARTLILLGGEALIVVASIFLGIAVLHWENLWLALHDGGGYFKIVTITLLVLLLSHWLDLYDPAYFDAKGELYSRLLLIPGLLALGMAAVHYKFPNSTYNGVNSNGINYTEPDYSALTGLIILTVALFSWRLLYSWLAQQPFLQERVYVLGTGERAQRLVNGLRSRTELGIRVVGRSADMEGAVTREAVGTHLLQVVREESVHRVIVAIQDRRETMPMQELLDLRLQGVHIEEATSWLEKISGRIEVEQLYPSWIIFATGFRFSSMFRLLRRFLNFTVSLIGVLVTLPIIPFVALAIKLDSNGPVLYRQRRVGKQGKTFYCYKFRTMRQDAEADTGATWAADDDPRITRTGKFLRLSRLDEIPQLWCVFKGDMAFVGPRPERPEFVEWLTKELPYYGVRHVVRPGITGWAQIRYKYGNTIDDAKEKLQYDLFYIKNASLGLDILIMFQTIKIVMLGRGAQ